MQTCFRPWPANPKPRYLYYGTWQGAERALDEVMMAFFLAPRSYTGEDMVEIYGHGSPFILRSIVQRCLDLGAQPAGPGEFTKRALIHGKLDQHQAAAVADLVHAENAAQVRWALATRDGYFTQTLNNFRTALLELRARIELGFDFLEEDVSFLNKEDVANILKPILTTLHQWVSSFEAGRRLQNGCHVVFLGLPNAGKSSLLNALLSEDRAIIHDEPGTTRDVISGDYVHDGLTFHCHDTAGLRATNDAVEKQGISKSLNQAHRADLILWVIDSHQETTPTLDIDLQSFDCPCHVVLTKCDLPRRVPSTWDKSLKVSQVSIHQAQSIMQLKTEISNYITCSALPDFGLVRETQYIQVQKQAKKLENVLHRWEANMLDEECLAEELKQCAEELQSMTGSMNSDDVLDTLFSSFCIGK
jgi:tRNA modification GTPase